MECEMRDIGAGASKQTEVGCFMKDVAKRKDELKNLNRELKVESNSGRRVIRWERFLPKKVVRVLLVENDDSTRHIVAALLRKCNYQVVAVADGLKAWEILKERNYNFDLVLTEVVMPSFSGTDLLSKIMSSDLCKNIPVIMTSSNDSISIVLKCMLMGAVDFLVKPVRKNELKNLWQHVWRKYQAVNPDTGNSNHRKLDGGSANETSSNHGSSNAGSGNIFEISDSCDKASDTRSSCSIAGIQTNSMPKQEGPGPPQIEYMNVLKKTDLELEKLGAYVAKDKSTEIEIKLTLSIHKKAVSTDEVGKENVPNVGPPYRKGDPDSVRCKEGGSVAPKLLDQHVGSSVPSNVIIGTEISENCRFQGLDIDHSENHLHESEKADAKRNTYDSGSLPSLELSLRSQLKSQNENDFRENHVLKHSEASAFSRYGNARRRLSCPSSSSSSLCIRTNELCNSNGQINTISDNSKNDPSHLIEMSTTSQVNRGEDSVDCQPSQVNSSSNKEGACRSYVPSGEDVCHPITGKSHHLQYGVGPFPVPIGAIPFQSLWGGHGATYQPYLYPQPSASLSGSTALPEELVVASPKPSAEKKNQANKMPQTVNYQPIYGNHNPPQFLHWVEQRTDVESASSRVLLMTSGEKVYQGGNSNCGVTIASERKGNNEDMDVAANAGIALERVRGDGIQNCTMNWLDCDRSRREAALTKFRLKRKDRCFEKKVRYHNRKKLAERRPRLKGQFVCQAVAESTTLATESD